MSRLSLIVVLSALAQAFAQPTTDAIANKCVETSREYGVSIGEPSSAVLCVSFFVACTATDRRERRNRIAVQGFLYTSDSGLLCGIGFCGNRPPSKARICSMISISHTKDQIATTNPESLAQESADWIADMLFGKVKKRIEYIFWFGVSAGQVLLCVTVALSDVCNFC